MGYVFERQNSGLARKEKNLQKCKNCLIGFSTRRVTTPAGSREGDGRENELWEVFS